MVKTIRRILIVGYGSIAKRHLLIARTLFADADIRVLRHQVSSDVPENSNGCLYNLCDAIGFKPNLAVIANPAPFHLEVAHALIDLGTDLLIEKPISSSLDAVQDFIELCNKKSILLQVGYNLRFLGSLIKYRDLIQQGIVGKVLSVRCEVGQYLPDWRPGIDYRKSVSALRELGGGALLELSHEIDYIRWIFGEIVWVKASMHQKSNLEINVEDLVHIIFESSPDFQNSQIVGAINLDFIRHDMTRSCVAIGESGSLRWNGLTGGIDIFEAHLGSWRSLVAPTDELTDTYKAEWTCFLEKISGRHLDNESAINSLHVMKIIDAIRKSNTMGGAICQP